MKLVFLLITILSFNFISAQSISSSIQNIKYSYVNEAGETIEKEDYLAIVRNKSYNFYSWSFFAQDTSIVRKLVNLGDNRKQVSYPAFVKKLEEITGRTFPENPVILINYRYLNDICSHKIKINNWDRFRIRNDKRYYNQLVKTAEEYYDNVIILNFFEQGISINPSKILKKYFHMDKDNFLKNNLFTKPVTCGSSAAIMPGGRTLIVHSEGSSSRLAMSIVPDRWKEIFEAE